MRRLLRNSPLRGQGRLAPLHTFSKRNPLRDITLREWAERSQSLGKGTYVVQLHLYMAGPWSITAQAQADGFDALLQTLQVDVQ
jgi:hypothetical protein